MIAGAGNASAAGVAPQESRTSTIEQADASSGGDRPSFYGLVKSMPEGGTVGEWMIGDQMVIADAQTEVQQMAGPLAIDGCAKVTLVAEGSNVAHEIESENMSDCTGSGGDDDHDDGTEIYGLVEVMPVSGTVGIWTVNTLSLIHI